MTTRVDFYLLSAAEESRALAVCRLVNKAYRLGPRVYILTTTPEESTELDRLLWTFNQGSFVPHRIYREPLDPDTPVLIGHNTPPAAFADVLIPLTSKIPEYFDRFARVAELVPADETERTAARERFRYYRDRGCTVQTHNL